MRVFYVPLYPNPSYGPRFRLPAALGLKPSIDCHTVGDSL